MLFIKFGNGLVDWLFRSLLVLSIAKLLAVPDANAQAAPLPTQPILRVNAMYAAITRLDTDELNRFLVASFLDNTVRLWSLPDGRLLRVLRVPISGESGSKAYAVAIAPDGETIAIGGIADSGSKSSVLIYRRASADLLRRLDGPSEGILNLAYSRDGRYLAAMLAGEQGIQVWDVTENYRHLPSDTHYERNAIWGKFDGDGRLITITSDGSIRVYGAGKYDTPVTIRRNESSNFPVSASLSPDGKSLAVANTNLTRTVDNGVLLRINVFSLERDLASLYSLDINDSEIRSLPPVAWSADGQTLITGGASKGSGEYLVRQWQQAGRGQPFDAPVSTHAVAHIVTLKDGSVVFGTTEPSFGMIAPSGRLVTLQKRETVDWEAKYDSLETSSDGKTVEMRSSEPSKLLRFSLEGRSLSLETDRDPSLRGPITTVNKASVANWINNSNPRINGQPIPLAPYDLTRSLAISPTGNRVVLGTDFTLLSSDREGKIIWSRPVSKTLSVNVAGNERLVVSAHSDGIVRWQRLSDGREVLALLIHNDSRRWVAWTPEGYYDASPGGEELIGWLVNRGPDSAPDFFPLSTFGGSLFYRPDVISRVLDTQDPWEALRLADAAAGRQVETSTLAAILPPVVRILGTSRETIFSPKVSLRFSVRSPAAPIKAVKVLIDGRPISSDQTLQGHICDGNDTRCTVEIPISVPRDDAAVSIVAENAIGVSIPATIHLPWPSGPRNAPKPDLYVLAIGAGRFIDYEVPSLRYAGKDAIDFATSIRDQGGSTYQKISMTTLVDEAATLNAIKEGLVWLKRSVTSRDVAMVFLSGQSAANDLTGYTFLPYDAQKSHLELSALRGSELKFFLGSLQGQVLLFLDTCDANGLDARSKGGSLGTSMRLPGVDQVINELTSTENGVVVFASSALGQNSFESDAWQHSAFTKALLEGLAGEGEPFSDRRPVSITTLGNYVNWRVRDLTNGRQTPTTTKPSTIPDLTIAATAR